MAASSTAHLPQQSKTTPEDEAALSTIPRLEKVAHLTTRLMVKGKPFLMLSGELHNSSLSSARYMSEVWPAMKAQGLNTLLGAVTWEMVEPVEGQFDFSELDKVIVDARGHGMHLVLLWFGTWKNGLSHYVPGWVKKDVKRFPRVHVLEAGGVRRTLEMVSPFCEEGWKADSRAFATLMAHLKDVDAAHSTVLMVQVENETGLLGDSRDRSRVAESAFAEGVPHHLLDRLAAATKQGVLHPEFKARFGSVPASESRRSWNDVFGPGVAADEAFMAYYISKYVGRVAEAGKAEYPIPHYANCWLNFDDPSALDMRGLPVVVGGGSAPGAYPSGGPVPHMMDIWKVNTPALDFISPDLYFHDYEGVCRNYSAPACDNPLFIPEQRRDPNGARRVWLAYATYGSLGCSPFGIDTGAEAISREFKLLSKTQQYILETTAAERFGFFFDEEVDSRGKEKWSKEFGEVEVIVERAFVFGKPGPGGGMVVRLASSEGRPQTYRFLCVGYGFQVRFKATDPRATYCGILKAEEKEAPGNGEEQKEGQGGGALRRLRTLNGDETRSGEFLIMPNEDPDYGGFPIAITIPARTGIAEVEAYVLYEDEEDF